MGTGNPCARDCHAKERTLSFPQDVSMGPSHCRTIGLEIAHWEAVTKARVEI